MADSSFYQNKNILYVNQEIHNIDDPAEILPQQFGPARNGRASQLDYLCYYDCVYGRKGEPDTCEYHCLP
jgi:hypothetical protein